MRAVRLLREAVKCPGDRVVDCAVGNGQHAMAFISKGKQVTGVDLISAPIRHPAYTHLRGEYSDFDVSSDIVWSSHTLEHVADPGAMLRAFRQWLADDGWLAIAVPTNRQNRLHVGHLSLWTPAHLLYNLIVAGFDCREALWYTEYCTVAVLVQKKDEISFEGRTAMPSEIGWLNQYMPVEIEHEGDAWLPNNWPEPTDPRLTEPPRVLMKDRW